MRSKAKSSKVGFLFQSEAQHALAQERRAPTPGLSLRDPRRECLGAIRTVLRPRALGLEYGQRPFLDNLKKFLRVLRLDQGRVGL